MVRCKEFYKKFEREGNFCEKNPDVANQIQCYIDYCKRYKFEEGSVNMNALQPLINIEGEMVHDMSLTSLKERLNKELRAKDVTRKLVMEIIKSSNEKIDHGDSRKITSIPDVIQDINRYQHSIRDISYETRKLYDELKIKSGIKNNNILVINMINYCDKNMDEFINLCIEKF